MSFKEWLRTKPYWLKGGIFGFIIGILSVIFLSSMNGNLPLIILLILSFPLAWLYNYPSYAWVVILPPLNLLIIGFIIGYIYQKIKSKK